MPMFNYRGRNGKGQLVSGRLEAETKSAIADQLFGAGVVPIEISPILVDPMAAIKSLLARRGGKISRTDLILLFRQLHTLTRAGVPILRALAGLQESASSPALAVVIEDMRVALDSGRELSASMKRHPNVFTPFHIAMIQVGEMTGRLEEVFIRLSEHLDFEAEIQQRIKQATRYPTFVIIAMVIAVTIANVFVIPQFSKMYSGMGQNLPFLTRVLMASSDFFTNYWWAIIAGAAAAVYSFKGWVATTDGRMVWDRVKLDLPIAGKIIKKATLARFARALNLSLKSGVPLVQALNTVADVVDNQFVRYKVMQMSAGVQRGESVLATAAATKVFSPVVLQMIAIGDETGALDDLMSEIATMYEREVEYDAKGLSAQIEPILIVFLAGFVLVLALGLLTPMWNLNKAMVKS
jgi:MSHA biogenesis protein MshG